MLDFWIIVTAAVCAVAAALPGCFLVLRKMSMMGDAISHAVLPGIAVAFLVAESRATLPMFLGAVAAGLVATLLTEWISRWGRVDPGASMGVVFTSLFALGLVLIVRATDQARVDLDPSCVLYGALELTPFDQAELFGRPLWFLGSAVPRAFLTNGVVCLLNLGIVVLLFKELRLAAFDPALTEALGFRARRLHYLLMSMVAVTTVAAFESVGSIIVIALLVVPPATALLLTHRLGTLLPLAALFGVAAVALGHWGAVAVPPWFGFPATRTSGMIALTSGLLFLLAWAMQALRTRRHALADALEPAPSSVSVEH